MKPLVLVYCCLVLLDGMNGGVAAMAEKPQSVSRKRTVEFRYEVTVNDVPADAKRLDLWIPVPHDNPYQKIEQIRVESPYPWKIHQGELGNRNLHIGVTNPEKSSKVTLSFTATRWEHVQSLKLQPGEELKPLEESERERWLKPDRLVPIDGKIRSWALEVVEDAEAVTKLEQAQAIYNHIITTVKYDKSGEGWGFGDIYYACDARRGNCTDFHAIFIGYARALGIPARFAIGVSLPPARGTGEIAGYHCWAECYVQGIGWIPVDASEAAKHPEKREYFFGAHDENRIEFTVGRDLILTPRQSGSPLNYFVYPYVEVDGAAYSQVTKQFTYRDVEAP